NVTADGVFAVDVANGTYSVTVTMGSGGFAKTNMGVFLQGVQVDSVSTSGAGVYAVKTYTVTINTGQLDLGLRNIGGDDPIINGLEIGRSGGGGAAPSRVREGPADLVAAVQALSRAVSGRPPSSGLS